MEPAGTQTMKIFLANSTPIILNHSLLESSLNVTFECKNKESKNIMERNTKRKAKARKHRL